MFKVIRGSIGVGESHELVQDEMIRQGTVLVVRQQPSLMIGARIKTAVKGWVSPSIDMGCSKDSRWRPKALRLTSIDIACNSCRSLIFGGLYNVFARRTQSAQVPMIAISFSSIRWINRVKMPDCWRMRDIVVLSPPGIMMPSI